MDLVRKTKNKDTKQFIKESQALVKKYSDVIDFLKRGSIKHKVAAIVDGDYWDKYRDIIKAECINNPNVLITSITESTERIDP